MTGADVPKELRSRDPEFIRAVLPTLWLASTVWFRAEVHGFENVPDEPVLFVGNHSGGGATPDTFVLLLAYNTFFTVEGRPLYALAHDTITAAPVLGRLTRKLGVVPAANSFAEHIFESGGSALVYPGGDVEALRPWHDRNKIVFSGRKGFLKLAHRCNVKIVPVVATGGHDTLFVLNDGRRTAQAALRNRDPQPLPVHRIRRRRRTVGCLSGQRHSPFGRTSADRISRQESVAMEVGTGNPALVRGPRRARR